MYKRQNKHPRRLIFRIESRPEGDLISDFRALANALDKDEIEGVLAHELSHVKHGDILIGTIAASMAGIIEMAVSRSREYMADKSGGELSGNPDALKKKCSLPNTVPSPARLPQRHSYC